MATRILHTIDPKDQAEVRRVQDLCHKLHLMPPPVAYVGLQTRICPPELLVDGKIPDGLKLDELGIEPALVYDARAQSWVRNAYNIVVTQMCGLLGAEGLTYGAGGLYNRSTAGSDRNAVSGFNHWINKPEFWVGAVGSNVQGIVVGTGTGAESFEHHALGTIVAHGGGAGQMSYTAQDVTTASYNAGTKVWTSTMIRYLNNNSGGAIVIGEAGIYVYVYSASQGYQMLCRDLLAATVNVPDTAQLKVTYTIESMAYPA